MDVNENWAEIKALFRESFRSSFHYAIASVGADGDPHVTPIGSLILGRPGQGIYFEKFTRNLPRNLDDGSRVCVLAVNSSRWFWMGSLFAGRFPRPPAVRLHGVAGPVRHATEREIALWQKRVGRVRFTTGHRLMWRDMSEVREISFDRIEPVQLGVMTSGLWRGPSTGERIS